MSDERPPSFWLDYAAEVRRAFPWWMRPFVTARCERAGAIIQRMAEAKRPTPWGWTFECDADERWVTAYRPGRPTRHGSSGFDAAVSVALEINERAAAGAARCVCPDPATGHAATCAESPSPGARGAGTT